MVTILVIEDDTYLRGEIVDTLGFEDFEVVQAANGQLGIEIAQKYIPDVIVSDVMMPNLDGYSLIKKIRSNTATAAIPFIFLTARATLDDVKYGMELGASAYLFKPFDSDELVETIRLCLNT